MMNSPFSFPAWLRALCLVVTLAGLPALAQNAATAGQPATSDPETIISTVPMQLVAEGTGAHGQLVVAREILSAETSGDLVYTITVEPLHGRVGLAGGDDEDFFNNKTGRSGYFAYQPREGYVG